MKKKILYFLKFFVVIMLIMTFSNCENNTKVVPIKSIALNLETLTLVLGTEEKLEIIISPENATNKEVIWSSSDENIAIVSQDGMVTALSEGETIISVSTMDGLFTANCVTTVCYEYLFTVSDTDQMNEVLNFIKENGNDKSYLIEIIGNVGTQSIFFPNLSNITLKINGNHNMTGGIGVRQHQHIIFNDINLGNANVYGDKAILTMQGDSSIKNNNESGVIVYRNGTFIMLSGTISENFAWLGGGVHVSDGGTFIMKEGTISKNITFAGHYAAMGGGVYVDRGTFIMYGGLITENNSNNFGGGVHVTRNSVFIMNGGIISKNKTGEGSGVFIEYESSFFMFDGEISDHNHIGVFLASGRHDKAYFTMKGGTIYGNDSGVVIDGSSSATMSGGVIAGNDKFGIMLALSNSFFLFSGGTIYGSQTTGVPEYLANNLALSKTPDASAKYGDGTDVLPHTDEDIRRTIYTIEGRQ